MKLRHLKTCFGVCVRYTRQLLLVTERAELYQLSDKKQFHVLKKYV